ncbi:hypothetical protein ACVWXN_000204 [Bradyrhizobium sp. i1.4.4]|uniref:Uncharacterized protein n=3 Tax=Bradyrhizobium TaxID=374 RepID=A0A1Y2JXD8_BRAJP|nr:hypothetical protein BSZ19_02550 [Bradyrhizobium japonicum]
MVALAALELTAGLLVPSSERLNRARSFARNHVDSPRFCPLATESMMATVENEKRSPDDARRSRSPLAWMIGVAFLVVLLGVLFLYNGGDSKTAPGPNTPNVVNNPGGSK